MERILLIRLSSLGDIVLTTPAIRAVRSHYPNAYIAMLVAQQSADVLLENPHLNEIIQFNRLAKDKDTREMFRILRILRQRQFTLTLDLQRKFRTELLMYLSGASERVGKGRLCTIRVPDPIEKHATERYFDVLHAAGIPAEDRQLKIHLSDAERTKATVTLENIGIKETQLKVGLFPGAGWKLREWMPERFASIGDKLVQDYDAQVIVFGGPNEVKLVDNVCELMQEHVFHFAGILGIRELTACIEKCNLFLTNDTGPMHIASAVRTPTVALFGPGNHIRFQPLGERDMTIRHDVPCNPCKQFTDRCKNNICMKKITVDEVWTTICRILG